MGTALVESSARLLPAVQTAIDRRNVIVQAMHKQVLRKDLDYGPIPGSHKPTLLKPGAEKLCSFFELRVEKPEFVEREEDWTGERHGGEPFFYYLICQRLTFNGETVAAQMGSCNSWEKKYRYRSSERACPKCGKAAIVKGKAEYGGGWVCFKKKDGCNAKYRDGDPAIESQTGGQVKNPDAADLANTILKMAQKRALVAATLLATNASEFFTQDVEEVETGGQVIETQYTVNDRPQSNEQPQTHPPQNVRFILGDELRQRIANKDKALAEAGICNLGDLVEAVERAGHENGITRAIESWGVDGFRLAAETVKTFEASASEEKAQREPGQDG